MRNSLVQTLSNLLTAATTAPASVKPPTIEDHTIIGMLGQGGMGTVYLAEDTKLERRVAVKVLRPEIAASAEAHERFLREARAMAKVRHPGVVGIHAFGEADGQIFLIMQYVDGETLGDRIKRQGKLSVEEAGIASLSSRKKVPSPKEVPRPRRTAARRVGFALVPGAFDMFAGSVWRGYFTMTAFVLAAIVAMTIMVLPGFRFSPSLMNHSYMLVPPTGMPSRFELFDIYPFVKTFFATVGVLGLLALVLHALRLPKILRGDAA